MEDTYTVDVRGKLVEFPTSVPPEEAEKIIAQELPPSGEEVREMIAMDPEYELTLDDYKVYEKWQESRTLGSKLKEGAGMVPGVIDHLGTVMGDGVVGAFSSNPLKAPANAVEGFAQGTKGLWQMLAHSENPDAVMFSLKDFLFGDGTVESRFKQTKKAIEFRKGLERNMTGDETVLMPKDWVDNRVVQATALVADPTVLAGFVTGGATTVAGAGGKLGRIAKIAELGNVAAQKAAQKALHATGTGMRVAAAPVTKAIDIAGKGIEAATGVNPKHIHAGAVAAGGAGIINPATATAGAVIVGAEGAELLGDALQRVSKGLSGQPSRVGALASVAADPAAPRSVRTFARAAQMAGGDLALDLSLRGATGAAVGAAVGGLIGYGYDDVQGGVAGAGAGSLLGGAGAGLFRSVEHGLGRVKVERQRADASRWVSSIENPKHQERAAAAASIMEAQIPGSSALLADADVAMRAIGGQLRFLDEATSQRVGGQQGAQGFFKERGIGEAPTLFLNLEAFGRTTPAHEAVHALLKTVSGGEQLAAARDNLFGTISPEGKVNQDGSVAPETVRAFAEKYRDRMKGEARDVWDGYIQDAFNENLELTQRLAAQREIADEFTAYYGGYASFSKGLFGKVRYNDSLMVGKADTAIGVVLKNTRRFFEGRTRRQLKMDFSGSSIESPFASAKNPGMKRFVQDVMAGSRDAQAEGNASIIRYNMRNAKPANMQALADAGFASAFVRDANGKVIRQRTVGEERVQLRAQFNAIRDALINQGIDPESRLMANDDGTQSFNLGEIVAGLDSPKQVALMTALEKFLGPSHRRFISQIASQMTSRNKAEFGMAYWSATTRSKKDSAVYASLGASERNVVPYSIEVSAKGGVYVRALDMNAIQKRFEKAWQKAGRKLYGKGDRGTALSEFNDYLDNLTEGSPVPSAELKVGGVKLGEEKRNFFYEVLGTVPSQVNRPPLDRAPRPGYVPEHGSDKVFKSFRVDRMAKLDMTGKSLSFTEDGTYRRSQSNFQPEDATVGRAAIEKVTNPETLREGDMIPAFKFQPQTIQRLRDEHGMTPDQLNLLAGKTGFAFASDWADSHRKYVTQSGMEIDVLHGGVGYTYKDGVKGRGAWASTDSELTNRVARKIQETDGIGIVVMGGPDSSASSRSFSKAFTAELEDSIKLKHVKRRAVDKIVRTAFRNERIGKPEIKTLQDYIDHIPIERNRNEKRGLTFEQRDLLVRTIGSHDNKKNLGILSWRDVLKKYNIQKGDAQPGQIMSVIQFDKGAKPHRAEGSGVTPHPSYEMVIPGEPIGMVSNPVMIAEFFKDFFEAEGTEPKAFTRKVQTKMPEFEIGKGSSKFMPKKTAADIDVSVGSLTADQMRSKLANMRLIPTSRTAKWLGKFPEYLEPVVDYVVEKRAALVEGKLTPRDVAKAYFITISSIGASAISSKRVASKAASLGIPFNPDPTFLTKGKRGDVQMRPEEAAAWWLGTEGGQRALDAIESGTVDHAAWELGMSLRDAFGRNDFRPRGTRSGGTGKLKRPDREFNLTNVQALTDELNAAKGNGKTIRDTLVKVKGVAGGKKGFIGHLLGMGDAATIDAVELNYWLTGEGSTAQASTAAKTRVAIAKSASPAVGRDLFARIQTRLEWLRDVVDGGDKIPKDVSPHIIHHWLWDKAKGLETTHAGLYEAMTKYQPSERTRPESGLMRVGETVMTAKAGLINFQPAWHGTPHEVSKFSSEKIGTGEGGQAFGHGLYFAQRKEIGEFYKRSLSKSGLYVHGEPVGDVSTPGMSRKMQFLNRLQRASQRHYANSGELSLGKYTLDEVDTILSSMGETEGEVFNYARSIEEGDVMMSPEEGGVYKVDLDMDDSNTLYWDRPFSEQHQEVQAALLRGLEKEGVTQDTYAQIDAEIESLAGEALKEAGFDGPLQAQFEKSYESLRVKGAEILKRLNKPSRFGAPKGADRQTGSDIYHALGRPKNASSFLASSGIRGISYPDGYVEGKSSNFVVFDDKHIKIVEKNGTAQHMPSDAGYMRAVKAGDMDAAQKMVDQAAKAAGYNVDMPLYHRTWSEFNEFKYSDDVQTWETGDRKRTLRGESGKAFWFGTKPTEEGTPANHNWKRDAKERMIPLYTKARNPLVVDGDTKEWAVEVFGEGMKDFPQLMTDEAAANVQSEGHDSVHLYYVNRTPADGMPNEVILFDPNQVKSSDPVTRDDAGNPIPLSERFNKASDDIRFMPSDDAYLAAVKKGDMEAVGDMVKIAANHAGFNVGPVFHGTSSRFNSFDMSKGYDGAHFFSESEDHAAFFGEAGSYFLKEENPMRITEADLEAAQDRAYPDGNETGDWGDSLPRDFVSEFVEKAKAGGHDSLAIKDMADLDGESTVHLPLKPNQIKLSDPVTYDDDGNVVPLSKRFSPETDDLRFQPGDDMGQIPGDAGPVERSVPRPVLSGPKRNVPTAKEALSWLTPDKQKKGRAVGKAKEGSRVGLRIDIPAYQKSNFEVYTVSVHDHSKNPRSKAGPIIGYEPYAYVEGPLEFVVNEKFAKRIKTGEVAKNTIAVVEGNWKVRKTVPRDIATWTQVGMNPKRHSYFYDRKTFKPVTGGDAAFSIGGTVFVKNAILGKGKDFMFQPDGGRVGSVSDSAPAAASANVRDAKPFMPPSSLRDYRRNSKLPAGGNSAAASGSGGARQIAR